MAEHITLEHFRATERRYHVYRIKSSALDHQSHYHDYFQVCFVTGGRVLHRQEGDEVELGPGDAFIVPPGFTHSLHFASTYSQLYSLSFEPELFHPGFSQSNAYRFLAQLNSGTNTLSKHSVRLRVVLDEGQQQNLRALMDCLIRQQELTCPAELSAAPSLISSIVYLLAQGYYQQPQNARRLKELTDYNDTLLQCTRYIDQNFCKSISLAGLSKQFGLSRSAFCALFPQFTGQSLRRYVAQKRILEAQRLIRTYPHRPLTQIAAEVGYEDSSTFYRNFLKITGVSPTTYRQNCNTAE